MAGNNDLRIKITAQLDESLSTKQLQSQLDKISKNLKLDIGIDTEKLKKINDEIKKIQGNLAPNGKSKPVIDDKDASKVKEIYKSLDDAVRKYKELGSVKIDKSINPMNKEIEKFQLTVTKANGEVEKLKFKLNSLQGVHGVGGFGLYDKSVTNNSDVIIEKQLQQTQQINKKLEQERQRNTEKRKSLEQEYEQWWLKSLKEREIKEISTEQKIQQNLAKQKANAQKQLQDLARTGKYTTDELKKIGQSINLSTSIKQIDQLKNRMVNMRMGETLKSDQDKIRESLQRVYNQGLVNQKFFQSFNSVINSAKNVAEIEKVERALKRVENHSKNSNKVNNLKQQLEIDANRLLQTHSKTVNSSGVNNIIRELNQITARTPQAITQIERLKMQLRQYRAEASESARSSMTLGTALSTAFQKFPIWIFTAGAIYTPLRMMRDAIQQIIDLDSQLITLERVSNGQIEINKALEDSIRLSEQLGVRIADLNDAMVSFARQGFRGEDLNSMAEVASLMSNVSELGLEESASALTAAIKGFAMEAEQAIDVVDKLNEVDNNYSITTKILSESLMRSAGAASVYGASLESAIGYTTAIGQVTRESGSVIGNSLKSIYSRITSVGSAVSSLDEIGISVKESSGEMRKVDDILTDLAGKWNDLSAEQQQNIGLNIAGRYQLSR